MNERRYNNSSNLLNDSLNYDYRFSVGKTGNSRYDMNDPVLFPPNTITPSQDKSSSHNRYFSSTPYSYNENESSAKKTRLSLAKSAILSNYMDILKAPSPTYLSMPKCYSQFRYQQDDSKKLDDLFFEYKAPELKFHSAHNLNKSVMKDPILYNTNSDYPPMDKSIYKSRFEEPLSYPELKFHTKRGNALWTERDSNISYSNFGREKDYNMSYNVSDQYRNFHIKDAKSVKEFAYQEEQNIKYRSYMEDKNKCIDGFMGDKTKGLFLLFDGHGGDKVSNLAKDKVQDIFDRCLYSGMRQGINVENAIVETFQRFDDELKYYKCENVGCTATLVYIYEEPIPNNGSSLNKSRRVVHCSNIGDSRCVLITRFGPKRMSYDHKASDTYEIDRIRKSGGVIFNGRVIGQLNLSRAFGDFAMKNHGVICTPYIDKHYITDKDRFLVIATDGVWDVITDDDMFKLSFAVNESDEYAKLIMKSALQRGSTDNISCIVLQLN